MSLVVVPYPDRYAPTFDFTPVEEVAGTFYERLRSQSPDIARMRRIQAVMNNEMPVPLPELQEDERPAVANLAQQGMGQLARRIASVQANLYFAPARADDEESVKAAKNKQRVVNGWYHDNHLNLIGSKRARQFLAYATAPVILKPSRKAKNIEPIPRWHTRDPLNTFPAEAEFHDCRPRDCIFLSHHTLGYLYQNFREAATRINKGINFDPEHPDMDMVFDCIEYVSESAS
jgi:hypothetical protein